MTHFCVCSHISTDADDTFKFRAKAKESESDSALFVQTVPKSAGDTVDDRVRAAWDIVKPRAAEWIDKHSSMQMTGPISMESLGLASLEAGSLESFEAQVVRMEMYPEDGTPDTWVMSVSLTHVPTAKQMSVEYAKPIDGSVDTVCMDVKPSLLAGCADLLDEWASRKTSGGPAMQFVPTL